MHKEDTNDHYLVSSKKPTIILVLGLVLGGDFPLRNMDTSFNLAKCIV